MNPESDAAAGLDRNKQLMRLMTQHQRRIFGYIYTLVPDRHEALAGCLQKLHARDRELVLTRYEPGSGVELAAQRSGRSLEAAYKALGRIRKLLHDCVSNQLLLE